MGIFELLLPDIGEGIAEAELVSWLVALGDRVRVDDPVAEVMTDKATVELPSPVNGTVAWFAVEEGQRVAVGAPLVRFEADGSDADIPEPGEVATDAERDIRPAGSPPLQMTEPGVDDARQSVAHRVASSPEPPDRPPNTALVTGASGRPLASPAVRRRAAEAGVDLRLVRGSGPAGRIEHRDLERFLDTTTATPPVGRVTGIADTSVSDIVVNGVRRVIAEHMAEAARRIPHFGYVEEIDVTELERLRSHMNAQRPDGTQKLTPLPFVVRAIVTAIEDHPEVNSRFDDDAMVVHRFGGVHVGIAVQTPSGLMVPVVRHAEARDIWDCAQEIVRLSTAARAGTATRSELSGSTISVTSLGALGGIASMPIINWPEVAIVGINKMQVRPVWDGRAFVPRTIMNLSSSFDHRVVDGWDAAVFIGRVKELIEQPALMFMRGA